MTSIVYIDEDVFTKRKPGAAASNFGITDGRLPIREKLRRGMLSRCAAGSEDT
jgi:hypothetical protein